jgi:hypothetical protein
MSYNLTLTNGTQLINLGTNTIDSSKTSIYLVGPNTANYGLSVNENYIRMLENFCNNSSPSNPLTGQLWFDSSTGNVVLKNYNGTNWKPLASSSTNSSAPSNPQNGDYWWDTGNQILKIYNGSGWLAIGPSNPPGVAVTAYTANTLTDNATSPHVVANLMVNNKLTGIVSSESASFVPQVAITGIPTVYPGLNLINGLAVSGNVVFTGNVSLPTTNSATFGNVVPAANLTYNLGSTTAWWNNIYGTAIHAQYADLAERFESDSEYAPGTVVEIGGPAEITQVGADLSEDVFGVISTNAAYLMNSSAGNNSTHPPIAVQGRVPVRVTGIISKGDRLVSAGNGLARSGKRSEITAWNVIGRALENKTTTDEGVIEAVVKLNS